MPQARGAQAQLLLQRETTFRTPPAPAARLMPFTKWNVGRNPQRQVNNTVSAQPLPAKRDKGDVTPGGTFESILDLRSIGNWLALLLGVPTAQKWVSVQPANVSGVTIHYAESGCPSGNGTLSYASAGTTLSWAGQGESAGAPVNVSAGGNFLIPSNVGGHGVYVTVTPASLPGGNINDVNITVHSTIKSHVFPVDLADRPSALAEIGHTGINKYQRFFGTKVSQLNWDLLNNDQNIQGTLIIGGEADPIPTSVFDAAPTSYSQFRACSALGRIFDGISGAGLGNIRASTISFDNQMTGIPLADGSDGYGTIDQADLIIKGTIDVMFDGASAYQLARDNTSTRLRLVSGATIGANTFTLPVDLLDVELEEANVPVEGKSGIWVQMNYNAHANGARRPVICLNNDVPSF